RSVSYRGLKHRDGSQTGGCQCSPLQIGNPSQQGERAVPVDRRGVEGIISKACADPRCSRPPTGKADGRIPSGTATAPMGCSPTRSETVGNSPSSRGTGDGGTLCHGGEVATISLSPAGG